MVKNFIMKDPLESEEAKWEESQNVMWSCPHHGKETYFNIKKLERQRKMREYVYVWFHDDEDGDEKMWVRITNGTRSRGQGVLDNQPVKLSYLKLGDIVKFKTDDDGITWAKTG
tara:strand:+ start:506 stop:847 length:342 start_codon:yes stop_codon:yes gene_type:complete